MVKAVIYDMDGLIIDSEPLWRKAEVKSFATVGVFLTEEMCAQTTGLRIDEVVEFWFHRNPWEGTSHKELEELIMKNVIQFVIDDGQQKKGVNESLDLLKQLGFRLALASSSGMALINPVLDKLQIRDYFEVIHSAEFEKYGKPHPEIYLSTAKQLNVNPVFCVAIEDSINGIISAKAAKMKCIAVPEKELLNDKRLGIADIVVASLLDINEETISKLNK